MVQLKESQIWESDKCVIQIQKMGENCFSFRGIIFTKLNDLTLNFNNVIYNEKNRLVKFIENLNMKEVNKKLIVREKNESNLGK